MYNSRILFAAWCFSFLLIPLSRGQQTAPSIEWQRTYGGTLNDILHCLQQTSDGGYVLGGRSISDPGGTRTALNVRNYDYWLVRLDASGNQLWDRAYGGTQYDKICSLVQTPNGGFLLAGYAESPDNGNKTTPAFGPRDFWLVQTDADGNKLWERVYGGTGGETLRVMRQTPDGGYILGGTSNSSTSGNKTSENYGWNSHDFWLVRINANGDKLWDRTYGSVSEDFLQSVEVTADGGFIVGGTSQVGASGNKTSGNYGGPDYWVIRLDANGNRIWDQSYGGWSTDELYAAVPTPDGGFLLGGYSASPPSGVKTAPAFGGVDIWIIKIDASGNQLWDASFGGNGHDNFMDSFTMNALPDGGVIFGTGTGGYSTGGNKTAPNYGGVDMWAVRLDAAGNKLWDFSAGAADTDVINTMQMTSDGGFIFGGQSYSDVGGNKTAPRQGGADFWVVKVASDRPVINTLPTLSSFAAQSLDEDQISDPIPFTVGDAETGAAALLVSAQSSNQALLSNVGIQFGGSGANRTLTLSPLANQFGESELSVIVADAHGGRTTNRFTLTVLPISDPPTVGVIPDQALAKNTSSAPIPVQLTDPDTQPTALTLTVSSSNPTLIPQTGLVLDGTGADRTLRITPAAEELGTATITLTVHDGLVNGTRTFVVSVQEVVVPPPTLISHWKLDEASGTAALDLLGRNPGLLVNGPERVAGRLGQALRFNGNNQYVNIPASSSLNLGSQLTISFWFKPSQLLNGSSGRKDLFKKFVSYWLILNYPQSDGKLSFVLNSGSPVLRSTTSQWLPSQWYHVAATYDGTTMRLYINGTLENSMAANVVPSVTGYPVQIGGNSEQAIFFPGSMDDVRLYSTPLSAPEVRALAGIVEAPNTPPQISAPSNQTFDEDAPGRDVSFTVQDSETSAADLMLTVGSSNPSLLTGLQLGGAGVNRTVRVTPAPNQFGTAQITLTVRDEHGDTRSTSFEVTVQPVNDLPTLTVIADQLIEQDHPTGPLAFSVSDEETSPALLTLRAGSSNPTLAPNAGILFAGTGSQRTVNINPAPGQTGTAQITVWVSDGQDEQSTSFQLTVVETNAPGAQAAYITSTVTGSPRNNFTGLVGYRITVGPDPIRVTALARFAYAGDKESHVVKIVNASTGVDVPGASVNISMIGAPAGQWKFAILPSSVTLQSGGSYYVVSEERLGGDRFGDLNTTIQTTGVAVHNSGVYAVTAPQYILVGGPPLTYGPPNFRYLKSGAATGGEPPVPTVDLLDPIEGAVFTLPTNITLRANVSAGVTNVAFYHEGVLVGRDTHSPAVLTWNTPLPGQYSLTAKATDTNGTEVVSGTVTITVRNEPVIDPGPVGDGQTFVQDTVQGEVRNNFSGFVGMKFTVGPQSLRVSELGRIIAPGNSDTHLVKLVRAADLMDVAGGSVSISTAGATVGAFKYSALAAPVILQANTMYYLVSQEVYGGDRWHGVVGTVVSARNVAVVNSGVFMGSGYGWSLAGTAAHAYGPVDFRFEPVAGGGGDGATVSSTPVAPTAGTLHAWTRGDQVLVNIRGQAGTHHVLEASDDFIRWTAVAEHTLERDEITIADVEAPGHKFRFYRAVPAP